MALESLLALQDQDIVIDQLEHKLSHLPEQATVKANAAAMVALEGSIATVQTERDAIARDQKRIEDEVATVETHAAEIHDKLYGGTVTSPKELQAFQQDHDALKRRQTELEDHVIELMEAAEPVDARLEALRTDRDRTAEEGTQARAALDEASGGVTGQLADARTHREELVANVPADQLAVYDKLRPQYGGIAIARLSGTNCTGCHLALSAVALDELRKLPPDAIAHCDECGRILVR
jgi:predicted  nucleic acid-binding Zn-ribbon protein